MNQSIKTTSVVMAQIQANAIEVLKNRGFVDDSHDEYYDELKRVTLNLHAQLKKVCR